MCSQTRGSLLALSSKSFWRPPPGYSELCSGFIHPWDSQPKSGIIPITHPSLLPQTLPSPPSLWCRRRSWKELCMPAWQASCVALCPREAACAWFISCSDYPDGIKVLLSEFGDLSSQVLFHDILSGYFPPLAWRNTTEHLRLNLHVLI